MKMIITPWHEKIEWVPGMFKIEVSLAQPTKYFKSTRPGPLNFQVGPAHMKILNRPGPFVGLFGSPCERPSGIDLLKINYWVSTVSFPGGLRPKFDSKVFSKSYTLLLQMPAAGAARFWKIPPPGKNEKKSLDFILFDSVKILVIWTLREELLAKT